jgi:glutaredoxin 3
MLKLYQAEWCPSCSRVRQWLTDHLIDYYCINVPRDKAARKELLKVSGQAGIPTLVDGDVIIADDDEQIIQYLAKKFPGPPPEAK